MDVIFEKITDLSSIDYDGLFSGSEEALQENFRFPKKLGPNHNVPTPKEYYLKLLNDAFNGNSWLQEEGDTFFCYLIKVDGIDMALSGGFIEEDGFTFRGHWYLSKDMKGSRNWIHFPMTKIARAAFMAENGITRFKLPTFVNSQIYKAVKQVNTTRVIKEVRSGKLNKHGLDAVTIIYEM